MKQVRFKRTLFLIYFLYLYVVAQFLWWAYFIYNQSKQIETLSGKSSSIIAMIFGEGSVFMLIIFIGFAAVVRSIYKERAIAKQKNNFLLSVTHELKTPITASKLSLQTLQNKRIQDVDKQKIVARALSQNQRLSQLVENILLASQVQTKAFRPYYAKINFSEILSSVCNDLATMYSSFQIKKTFSDTILIKSDKQAIQTIAYNLIENAIKYSGDSKNILINAELENDQLMFEVVDNGIGIAKEYKDKIFEKFFRAENEDTRTTKGTGLGLYIVYELIRALRGEISVHDSKPNGTTIKVILPHVNS